MDAPKLPPHPSHTDKGMQLRLQDNCCCNPPCLSQELLRTPKDIFDLSGAGAASNPASSYSSLLLTQQLSLIPHFSFWKLNAQQLFHPPCITSLHRLQSRSPRTLPITETCSCKHYFPEGKINTFPFFHPRIIYTVSINRFKTSRHAKKSSKRKDSIPEIQPRQTQTQEHPLAAQNHSPEGEGDHAPMSPSLVRRVGRRRGGRTCDGGCRGQRGHWGSSRSPAG